MVKLKFNTSKSIQFSRIDDCESGLLVTADEEQESHTKEEESGEDYAISNTGSDEAMSTDDPDLLIIVLYVILFILVNFKSAPPEHLIDLTPNILSFIPIIKLLLKGVYKLVTIYMETDSKIND